MAMVESLQIVSINGSPIQETSRGNTKNQRRIVDISLVYFITDLKHFFMNLFVIFVVLAVVGHSKVLNFSSSFKDVKNGKIEFILPNRQFLTEENTGHFIRKCISVSICVSSLAGGGDPGGGVLGVG